jgi:hypothetical protein
VPLFHCHTSLIVLVEVLETKYSVVMFILCRICVIVKFVDKIVHHCDVLNVIGVCCICHLCLESVILYPQLPNIDN